MSRCNVNFYAARIHSEELITTVYEEPDYWELYRPSTAELKINFFVKSRTTGKHLLFFSFLVVKFYKHEAEVTN